MQSSVVVVGAGPSGLMLALELAVRGVSVSIFEKRSERSQESRALVLQARSLEFLDNLGVVEDFLRAGRVGVGLELWARGAKRVSMDFSDIGADDTRFPYVLFQSQAETERLLEEALSRHGVRVERGLELVDFDPGQDDVKIDVRRGDVVERHVARYLVGCDGAHSAVRKRLGLSFDGDRYPQGFLLGDVRLDWPLPKDKLVVCIEREGLLAHFPLTAEASRVIVNPMGDVTLDERPAGSEALSLEELQSAVTRVSPVPAKLSDPKWLARFHLHHRGVKRYRVGRVFLVGDAAHIHSPAGGQGMNTGLQDAANLGWKLAQALKSPRGESERLLESYHEERWPVGQKLLSTTDRMFVTTTSPKLSLRLLRLYGLPLLLNLATRRRSVRKRAFRFISQLAVRYRASGILPMEVRGADRGPAPGERAPDVNRLHERLRGPGHDFVVFGGDEAAWREVFRKLEQRFQPQLAEPLRFHAVPAVAPYGSGAYLVRPDGHIAARAAEARESTFVAALQRLVTAA